MSLKYGCIVKAEVRSVQVLDASDLAEPEAFRPADPAHFCVWVRAMVGPAGAPGEESFDFAICTGSWLRELPLEEGYALLRHHVLVSRWDPVIVRRIVDEVFASVEGETWDEIGDRLARNAHWEFEDYRE